jgi:hypothetical protein
MQTLQGKIAAYDYYTALEKLTDNVGLAVVKVCAFVMLRVACFD